jgi:CheY-like chemotaxis protein
MREEDARLRVLIVDDEPLIGTTLKVLLGDEHEVELASSGEAARNLLGNGGRYDVILCDLMMPGVSGMALHAWLEEHHPALAPRVVFMSGGVFTDEARDFLEGVDNARVEKPFDHDVLLQIIRDLGPLA